MKKDNFATLQSYDNNQILSNIQSNISNVLITGGFYVKYMKKL